MESLEVHRPVGPSNPNKPQDKYQFVDLRETPSVSPSPDRASNTSGAFASSQGSSQNHSQSSQSTSQGSLQRSGFGPTLPSVSRPIQRPDQTGLWIPKPKPKHPVFAPFRSPTQAPTNQNRALVQGDLNKAIDLTDDDPESFGSSILKAKNTPGSKSSGDGSQRRPFTLDSNSGRSYIKPGHGGFDSHFPSSSQSSHPFSQNSHGINHLQHNNRLQPVRVEDSEDVDGEVFDLNAARITAADYERCHGDADKQMQELLSGAVGDGEDNMGDEKITEGEDQIEGFADDMRLMPHQVRGVRWMRQRESGRKYGGILADDMGLGKTVQTLARIVEGSATTAERKAGWKAGTLIVAPLAVMEQWASEVKNKTKPGMLRCTTHHGPSRTKNGKDFEDYDVVVTTFQTLASEYQTPKSGTGTPVPVSADVSVADSDSDSDDSFIKQTKKKLKPKVKTKRGGRALFEVKWLRVVIDEAQNIKNRKTKAAIAACELQAKYRWCLTGTPIQNNVEELFTLFKFIKARPLDNWDTFRVRVAKPVKEGYTQIAMKRLHVILQATMLRRTKDATIDGKPILNLPARIVTVVNCDFDDEERAFYDALQAKTELTFNKYVKAGTAMANYTSVLTMLLRLRQACDHPSLVTNSISMDKDAIQNENQAPDNELESDEADELADMLGGLGVDEEKKCQLCFVKLTDQSASQCMECLDLARQAGKPKDDEDLPPTSAKIRTLIKLLKDVDERSDSTEKTIVFSQFTSFLNLVEPFLKKEKIRYVRYDGSMRNEKRQESLDTIKLSPQVRVILISFKAGSTGLNLTCCNNVILMDLWWNPALEDQAFDRAHRLGQKLDVNIFKLTIEATVEDRILELQEKKRELAQNALSGNIGKNMKLTMSDIMALFRSE